MRQVTKLRDFDAITDVAPSLGWDIDFRLLGAGKATGEIETITTSRAVLQRNRFGWKLHQRGATPGRFRTFGIGVNAHQAFPWCGQETKDDWLLSFPADGEYDSVSDESFHCYSLTFHEELVRETASLLGGPSGDEMLHPTGVFDANSDRVARVRDMVGRVVTAARKQPTGDETQGLIRAIEWDLLSELLLAFAAASQAKTPTAKLRTLALKRSTDFMEAVGNLPITVRELCEIADASWRTLDYAFKERYGMSPKAYLRARCLNGVHQDLRDAEGAGTTVGGVAVRWGFWHVGQFAQDYRKLFGELPSETLRGEKTGR